MKNELNQGMMIYPLSVNDEPELRKMLAAGVSGMVADYPRRLRRILGIARSL